MTRNAILAIGMYAIILLVVLGIGCVQEKKKEYTLIGLEKLDTNDELNIVNWTVQGITGPTPKLNSVDWDLKSESGNVVWSGIAVKYTKIPDTAGVYYIDVNQNNKIDVGDTFCVKAPEDGHFTLHWLLDGNIGEYMAEY